MNPRSEEKPQTVFAHAKMMLGQLAEKAKKMKTKTDLEEDSWKDDAYQKKEYAVHNVDINLIEYGLPEAPFFAAGKLVTGVRSILQEKLSTLEIDMYSRDTNTQLIFTAKYKTDYIYLHDASRKNLSAPIASVPFNRLLDEVDNMYQVLMSTEWEKAAGDDVRRVFKTGKERSLCTSYLFAIAASCKEFDSKFDFNLRDSFSSEMPLRLRISKTQLEKARQFLTTVVCQKKLESSDAMIKQTLASAANKSPAPVKLSVSETKQEKSQIKEIASLLREVEITGAPGGPSFGFRR